MDNPINELEPWIETYTGKKLHFLEPSVDEICIDDIAHALSNECRFGGHTSRYYSVAEHSILVATVCSLNELALAGLLHDASEAYLRDIPSPIKAHLHNYRELETRLMDAIADKFGLDRGFHEAKEVKRADTLALKAEARALLPSKGESWLHLYPTDGEEVNTQFHCFSPEQAEATFLGVFKQISGIPILAAPTEQEKRIILAR
jgi:hypothetical protein